TTSSATSCLNSGLKCFVIILPFVNGDYNITSNSVAKFSMPLQFVKLKEKHQRLLELVLLDVREFDPPPIYWEAFDRVNDLMQDTTV
ncbi:MAG: hypothetical protein ACI8VC_001482, partial [Candidatus Endobugula sp.]